MTAPTACRELTAEREAEVRRLTGRGRWGIVVREHAGLNCTCRVWFGTDETAEGLIYSAWIDAAPERMQQLVETAALAPDLLAEVDRLRTQLAGVEAARDRSQADLTRFAADLGTLMIERREALEARASAAELERDAAVRLHEERVRAVAEAVRGEALAVSDHHAGCVIERDRDPLCHVECSHYLIETLDLAAIIAAARTRAK